MASFRVRTLGGFHSLRTSQSLLDHRAMRLNAKRFQRSIILAAVESLVAAQRLGANLVSLVQIVAHLDRTAAAWSFERRTGFSRPALARALADGALLRDVDRLKGVLRTGPEHWALVQVANGTVSFTESSWRRYSRIEVLMREGATADWSAWDALWAAAVDR